MPPLRKRRYASTTARSTKRPRSYTAVRAMPLVVRSRSSRTEVKASSREHWDNAVTDSSVSLNCTYVTLGNTSTTRTGRVVQGRELKYFMKFTLSTDFGAGSARVIAFRWDDDSTPSPAQVLTVDDRVTSTYNIAHQGKWKILLDKLVTLNTGSLYGPPQTSPLVYAPAVATLSGTIKTPFSCRYDDQDNDQDFGSVYFLVVTADDASIRTSLDTQFFYTDV